MKKKNTQVLALKQLCKTSERINLRGHRNPEAPSYSDAWLISFEGHGKKSELTTEVQVSGSVHGGHDDQVAPGESSPGNPHETYTGSFRPTEGFWYLYAQEGVVRSVIASLPDDASVSLEVWLDGGTHAGLVKHRLHHDLLFLHAEWMRGNKTHSRRFLLDTIVSRHNSNRWGG